MNYGELLILALNAGKKAGDAILQVYKKDHFDTILKEDKSPVTEADLKAHRIIEDILQQSGIPLLSEEGKDIPWPERRMWNNFWLIDPLDGTKEFIKRNDEFTVNIALVHQKKPVLGIIYAPAEDLMYAAGPSAGARKLKHFNSMRIDSLESFLASGQELPIPDLKDHYSVVASRTHSNRQTKTFIRSLRKQNPDLKIISRGSALKFCLVAEGSADVYPRMGPTWEWDTGAGQAIVESAGCSVTKYDDGKELLYNKEILTNPWFIVRRN